ncbi:hypothetical protein ACIOG4_37575 [Streptomyces microflavus]|uniref:hypothetical protein n=1 Tax=Streptomyces microflavus TaxID=1919 RepID=UPI0037F7A490
MTAPTPSTELTRPAGTLSLSDISRYFGLSRTAAQKWHRPARAATGAAAPRPALHAVADAIGMPLGPDVLDSTRPRYPAAVVTALGQALGYLDDRGRPIAKMRGKGRGRWLPLSPTTDPATGAKRHYVNHLATALGVTNEAVETGLNRHSYGYARPDGTDELGRSFWWAPTARRIVRQVADGPSGRPPAPAAEALLDELCGWLATRSGVEGTQSLSPTAVGIDLADGTRLALTLSPGPDAPAAAG